MTEALIVLAGLAIVVIVVWACAYIAHEWAWRDAEKRMPVHRPPIPDENRVDFWGDRGKGWKP